MSNYRFTGILQILIDHADRGRSENVDFIMQHLTSESTFAMTRYVDYSLSRISSQNGFERIVYYLFNGTQIQRNYASLYLNRLGEWNYVKEAWERGLIDDIQAFAR